MRPTVARVLEHLQQVGTGVGVDDVAAAIGMHPNSARAALEQLVAEGLVVTERRLPTGRGRPARLYRADPERSEPDPRVREHGALAGALAAHLAATSADPTAEAMAAGVRWGRSLAAQAAAGSTPTAQPASRPGRGSDKRARGRVVELLAVLEFGPRPDRPCRSVTLTTCPLLDVARQYPDVVCQVHRGMVAGALAELGAGAHEVDLQPFAEPDGCALTMTEVPPR